MTSLLDQLWVAYVAWGVLAACAVGSFWPRRGRVVPR